MKIVINIPETDYELALRNDYSAIYKGAHIAEAIKTGTPLTKTPEGRWIKEESILGWDGYSYQCSNCGRIIHLDTVIEDLSDYPYCHCGAKMNGGSEDADSN